MMLDSTSVKVHADGTGSLKKTNGPQSIGRSRGGLTTKVHLLALDDRRAWSFSLSAGGIGTMLRRVAGCSSRAV